MAKKLKTPPYNYAFASTYAPSEARIMANHIFTHLCDEKVFMRCLKGLQKKKPKDRWTKDALEKMLTELHSDFIQRANTKY